MALSLLVLTDFFQPADHALAYADGLALAIGAQLVLLHVRRDALLDPEHLTGRVDTLGQEAIDLALNTMVQELAAPATAEVAHGRVADAVAAALGRHQPALVVLGHRDTDSMADELVSTAPLDMLRTAPQPMLVVPVGARPTVPRRLLLALDAEPFSLGGHTGLVRHLFDALPAELTVLHVGADREAATTGTAAAVEAVERTGLALDLGDGLATRSLVHDTPVAASWRWPPPASSMPWCWWRGRAAFWGRFFTAASRPTCCCTAPCRCWCCRRSSGTGRRLLPSCQSYNSIAARRLLATAHHPPP